MDLVLKGRGIRITDQVRRTAEHKLAKIGRLNPKVLRLEVELTLERNPRIGGSHRVEVACDTARQTFRAGAVVPCAAATAVSLPTPTVRSKRPASPDRLWLPHRRPRRAPWFAPVR